MTDEEYRSLPDECVELHFVMKTGDRFSADMTKVTLDYIERDDKHRSGEQKRWTLRDGDLEREIVESEVSSVMPVVKDECTDAASELEAAEE